MLRCGGTLLYRQEVCYVVIITYEGDGIHDDDEDFPPINSADVAPQCDWSLLLNEDGRYNKKGAGYPMFTPQHSKKTPDFYHDHIVFAVHLPESKGLSLPKESLVDGGPLKTEHTKCHKYRKFGDEAADECKTDEDRYAESRKARASPKRSKKKHTQQ